VCISCTWGQKNPWADWPLIFFGGRCPWRNHVFQIWWRSVKGFSVGWWSIFAISHWLWRLSMTLTQVSCERVMTNRKSNVSFQVDWHQGHWFWTAISLNSFRFSPDFVDVGANNGLMNEDKKAQLSLKNLRDAKVCQKLLQFDVKTSLAEERLAVSTKSIRRWKVHLVVYNFVADNTALSPFV